MVRIDGIIEVEVAGPRNENLIFPPIAEKRIRGRLVFATIDKSSARTAATKFAPEIPGQVLGLDADKRIGWIREPLWADKHSELRDKIERAIEGVKFAPERQEFPIATDDALSTWLYWLKSTVDGKLGELLSGEFPAELPGKPRKDFFRRFPDGQETLLAGILALLERQGSMIEALTKRAAR